MSPEHHVLVLVLDTRTDLGVSMVNPSKLLMNPVHKSLTYPSKLNVFLSALFPEIETGVDCLRTLYIFWIETIKTDAA